MPPRASWKGHLKLSLISFPVRLYNAISTTSKIRLNQLHGECGQRIKQQLVCEEHGTIERSDIVKGYEHEKGQYVVLPEEHLDSIMLESSKTIEIEAFVDPQEIDPIVLSSPYYVAPDGAVAQEAFALIREAMRQSERVAVGRVVMSGREHIVLIAPHEDGFLMNTLRYSEEVRSATAYFEDIKQVDVKEEELAMAIDLIEKKTVTFDAEQYTDRYQEAMLDVIKSVLAGEAPEIVQEREAGNVVDLMAALKQSMAAEGEAAPAEAAEPKKPAAKKKAAPKKPGLKKVASGGGKKAKSA